MKKKTVWWMVGLPVALLLGLIGYMLIEMGRMKPLETGRINEYLYVGKSHFANFFICSLDGHSIAFDAGMDSESVEKAMGQLGLSTDDISHVFLTHSDGDHSGGLPVFGRARILLSEEESTLFDGREKRKIFFFRRTSKLPVSTWETFPAHESWNVGPFKVQSLPTPGHTPGSTSYLINDSILIVGDALQFGSKGEFEPIFRPINNDYFLARETLKSLDTLEVSLVVSAHDGYIRR